VHSGSRGFGHQVCTDSLREMGEAMRRYGIDLPDRQLACVPVKSPEGEAYLASMRASANFAWANRQGITHFTRQAFKRIFGEKEELRVVYDVCHNIAKLERHTVNGREMKVMVHRKGATRAFPPGRPEVPEVYKHVGQPVLIPGSMGTASYVLVGTEGAMQESFGTTCHGASAKKSPRPTKTWTRSSTWSTTPGCRNVWHDSSPSGSSKDRRGDSASPRLASQKEPLVALYSESCWAR
jgi:tRNA-splicing ligase RtcB